MMGSAFGELVLTGELQSIGVPSDMLGLHDVSVHPHSKRYISRTAALVLLSLCTDNSWCTDIFNSG